MACKPGYSLVFFFFTRCPQETDVSALHRNEMMKAGVAAEKEFKKDNPQVSNLQLKNDPLKEFHKGKPSVVKKIHFFLSIYKHGIIR